MIKATRIIALMILAVLLPAGVMAQEHFKRDIEQISFIPKGQWITGVSVGYSHSDQNNYQFFIFENVALCFQGQSCRRYEVRLHEKQG